MMEILLSFIISLIASIIAVVLALLIERKRLPYLVMKPEGEDNAYITYPVNKGYPVKGKLKRIRVVVLNEKMHWSLGWLVSRQTAEICRATIEFLSQDGKTIFVMKGRWVSTPEISYVNKETIVERVLYPDPVSIAAGKDELLDIAVQEENDTDAYGWNNEAYLNSWKTPKYKLSVGDYSVKISITTQNGVSFSNKFKLKINKVLSSTVLENCNL